MAYTVQENKITADGVWGGLGVTSADYSMGANLDSASLDALYFDKGAIQLFWSGADDTDATIVLQASLQPQLGWSDVPGSARTLLCASGSVLWDISSYSYRYFRIVYTANSVTAGTWNVYSLLKTTRG